MHKYSILLSNNYGINIMKGNKISITWAYTCQTKYNSHTRSTRPLNNDDTRNKLCRSLMQQINHISKYNKVQEKSTKYNCVWWHIIHCVLAHNFLFSQVLFYNGLFYYDKISHKTTISLCCINVTELLEFSLLFCHWLVAICYEYFSY